MGPSIYSIAAFEPYLPNAGSDHAISYLGNYWNIAAGISYSFGRDAVSIPAAIGGASYSPSASNCPGDMAGDGLACLQITALIGYWGDRVGGQFVCDELRGGPGGLHSSVAFDPPSPLPLPTSADKTTRYMASGYIKFGSLDTEGGAVHRRTRTQSTFDTTFSTLESPTAWRSTCASTERSRGLGRAITKTQTITSSERHIFSPSGHRSIQCSRSPRRAVTPRIPSAQATSRRRVKNRLARCWVFNNCFKRRCRGIGPRHN